MATTITIDSDKIIIAGVSLDELLQKVYQKGKTDALLTQNEELVTFINLKKELAVKGRKISVQTLTNKARAANVKIRQFDGKRLAIYRGDIPKFLSF